jgi:hypothetical protein
MSDFPQFSEEEQAALDQAFRELDEEEVKGFEGFGDIEKVIKRSEKQFKSIRLTDGTDAVEIRFRATIPLVLRGKMQAQYQQMIAAVEDEEALPGVDTQVRPMCELLAAICPDVPWNDWRSWAYLEKRCGETSALFKRIMKTIEGDEQKFQRFR